MYPRKGPRFTSPVSRTTGQPRRYKQYVWVVGGTAGTRFGWGCVYGCQDGTREKCASAADKTSWDEAEDAIREHILDYHEGTVDVIEPRSPGGGF